MYMQDARWAARRHRQGEENGREERKERKRKKGEKEKKKLAVQARSAYRPRAVSTAEGRSAEPPSGLGRPWSTQAKLVNL